MNEEEEKMHKELSNVSLRGAIMIQILVPKLCKGWIGSILKLFKQQKNVKVMQLRGVVLGP